MSRTCTGMSVMCQYWIRVQDDDRYRRLDEVSVLPRLKVAGWGRWWCSCRDSLLGYGRWWFIYPSGRKVEGVEGQKISGVLIRIKSKRRSGDLYGCIWWSRSWTEWGIPKCHRCCLLCWWQSELVVSKHRLSISGVATVWSSMELLITRVSQGKACWGMRMVQVTLMRFCFLKGKSAGLLLSLNSKNCASPFVCVRSYSAGFEIFWSELFGSHPRRCESCDGARLWTLVGVMTKPSSSSPET